MKQVGVGLVLVLAAVACGAAGTDAAKGAPAAGTDAAKGASAEAVVSGARQQPGSPKVVVKRDNPCSVLLPSEAEQILGTPITLREVVDEETCHFDYVKPAPGTPPYFEMKVHFAGGKIAVMATRMAGKLMGGDSGFEKLTGIGDEAWLGPMASLLVFSKGDAGVELDLRMVPDGRVKGIRMAKLIAGRLAAAGF